jgi:hypothetical protein
MHRGGAARIFKAEKSHFARVAETQEERRNEDGSYQDSTVRTGVRGAEIKVKFMGVGSWTTTRDPTHSQGPYAWFNALLSSS